MRWLLPLLLAASPALAQDLQGNDTAGNWRVTHHAIHDIWNVLCDEREEQGALVQRCYIRYVDVFSPRPKFGGMFLFVTPEPKVDFGLEPGTLFLPGDFRIEDGGTVTWQTNRPGCLTGLSCTFEAEDAETLLQRMQGGGEMRFTFRDRHGQAQDLSWPLVGFPAALADYQAELGKRGLLDG